VAEWSTPSLIAVQDEAASAGVDPKGAATARGIGGPFLGPSDVGGGRAGILRFFVSARAWPVGKLVAMDVQNLFDEYAGAGFVRQSRLVRTLGEHDYDLDLDAGTIAFIQKRLLGSRRIVARIEALGSESELSRTWLWAWANDLFSDAVCNAAMRLHDIGKARGVRQLERGSFPLAEWSAEQLALTASGMFDLGGYYVAPYDGGRLFVLVDAEELRTPPERPLVELSRIVPAMLATGLFCDQPLAIAGAARALGITLLPSDRNDSLVFGSGRERARARFDGADRWMDLSSA
jgi:hypothetical protein